MSSLAGTHSVDLAAKQASREGGMTISELERFLTEMRQAPAWRARADMECDYYDNNQHTPDEIALAESRGLPIVTANMIFPTINMVLGMEAKTRTDWKVLPDGPNVPDDFADAMTVKLTEAERVTNADRACADAYASMMKSGIGWVGTGYNLDPFKYPHRVEFIDRREIWWDMRGRNIDTSDWRYLVRRKWHDVDTLLAMFPKQVGGVPIHEIIAASVDNTAHWDYANYSNAIPMAQDGLVDRDIRNWEFDNWRDSERRRAMLYETWYRKPMRGYTLELPDGRVIEYQEQNPIHQAIVGTGIALPRSAVYTKVRLSWWIGPFRIYDMASPYAHNFFPYVPFICYREDRTGIPFGQIRVMIHQQDEINARRSKMLWQLSAVRTKVRKGAVADLSQLAAEVSRPDAQIVIEDNQVTKNRSFNEIIEIDEHLGLNAQQMQVYQDAKATIQQVVGVYGPMLGDAKAGADAGVAIDMLIQQGNTTLAEPNDNYRMARTLVGQQLLSNIAQKWNGKPQEVKLPNNHARSPGKRVMINKPAMAEGGLPYTEFDAMRLQTRVALADVPPSPTYQQQEFSEISKILAALPEQAQPAVLDMWVEASSSPRKHEIADRVRKMFGIQGPEPDPATMSQEQLQQALADKQAEMQRQMQQAITEKLVNEAQAAEITAIYAKAKLDEASALEKLTKAGKITGTVIDQVAHPEMQGTATVKLEKQEPPKPALPGARPPGAKPGEGRDSTTIMRSA